MSTNFFIGEGMLPQFAHIVYEQLLTRKWVSNTTVMQQYYEGVGKKMDSSVSKCEGYGELKKAFSEVIKALKEQESECVESRGGTRDKEWRYIGVHDNPLEDRLNAAVIRDMKTYAQFCQDSAGLIPMEWIAHFFPNTQDLLNIRKSRAQGRQCISADVNRLTRNIDLLPKLYEAIVRQRVIRFDYKDFDGDLYHLLFHPQYLKEHEGRWQLFGKTDNLCHKAKREVYNVALDRIVSDTFMECADQEYQAAEPGYYERYFKNIVGVSHYDGESIMNVRIRAHNAYIYGLVDTKKIHPSQEPVLPFGEYDGQLYGEFEINVEFNNELVGRILYFGEGLEVVAPDSCRERFCQRVRDLAKRYED